MQVQAKSRILNQSCGELNQGTEYNQDVSQLF